MTTEQQERMACEYRRADGSACGNHAGYLCEYTTPDDRVHMRKRASARRCFHHAYDPKFFVEGASQLKTFIAEPRRSVSGDPATPDTPSPEANR